LLYAVFCSAQALCGRKPVNRFFFALAVRDGVGLLAKGFKLFLGVAGREA
jgi:hypothetical protein